MKRLKKYPFVASNLQHKLRFMNTQGKKIPIKTWSRSTTIVPAMLGYIFCVHNGRVFFPVFIDIRKIGHKLGEFSPTRRFKIHKKRDKKGKKKGKS